MSIVNAHLIGRLGNMMFQAAFARAYAEKHGMELRTNAWPGQQIFEGWDHALLSDEGHRLPENYRQTQADLIYTRADCRRWFRFNEQCRNWMEGNEWLGDRAMFPIAHRRVGDYARCGYVVVSHESYFRCAEKLDLSNLTFVSEEFPSFGAWPSGGSGKFRLNFLADFLLMVQSPVILRGNSSFSWWAATLSNAKVYSPVIDGLEGGKEQDVEFVSGNWPRLSNLECCSDLHLKEA